MNPFYCCWRVTGHELMKRGNMWSLHYLAQLRGRYSIQQTNESESLLASLKLVSVFCFLSLTVLSYFIDLRLPLLLLKPKTSRQILIARSSLPSAVSHGDIFSLDLCSKGSIELACGQSRLVPSPPLCYVAFGMLCISRPWTCDPVCVDAIPKHEGGLGKSLWLVSTKQSTINGLNLPIRLWVLGRKSGR